MACPDVSDQAKALLSRVPSKFLWYPLVFVDGELRVVGSAEHYDVLQAVKDPLPPTGD